MIIRVGIYSGRTPSQGFDVRDCSIARSELRGVTDCYYIADDTENYLQGLCLSNADGDTLRVSTMRLAEFSIVERDEPIKAILEHRPGLADTFTIRLVQ